MLSRGLIMSGCEPEAADPEIMGKCDNCGEELREDYTYFEDSECNKFCSKDCAAEFHKITEKEW